MRIVCNDGCERTTATTHIFTQLKGFEQALTLSTNLQTLPKTSPVATREANSPLAAAPVPVPVSSPPRDPDSDDSDFELPAVRLGTE